MGSCSVMMVVSYWIFGSMRPSCVTLASCFHGAPQCHTGPLFPWALAVSECFPWFHGAAQWHNGPLVPWGHRGHKGLHYSIRSCCVTMVSIIQWGPAMSQRSPWFHGVRMAPLSRGAPHYHCGPLDSMRNSCRATMAPEAAMVSSETLQPPEQRL